MSDRKFKLLIIDDSISVLKRIEKFFIGSPYPVTTCKDPLKAYEMIENEHFDIVISDIMMPKMDGLTLLRQIKKFNGTIQVIIITGHITINNTLNAFRYGANDIFFKPLKDLGILRKAVDQAARKLIRIDEILQVLAQKRDG